MSSPFINTANPAGSPKLTELRVSGTPEPQSDAEFERFQDLAHKLVHTPKREVDEKRAERA